MKVSTKNIKKMLTNFIVIGLVLFAGNAYGEIASGSAICIATGDDVYMPQSQVVTVTLQQSADYISIPITLSSDQGNPEKRFEEIRNAINLIETEAEKNPNIYIHSGPVSLSAKQHSKLKSLYLSSGGYYRPESIATLYIFAPLSAEGKDVFDSASQISHFINCIKFPDKTECKMGKIMLAVKEPEQYRDKLLLLILEDVKRIKNIFKTQGEMTIKGLDSPVYVRQIDRQQVELFLNYTISIKLPD